MPANASTDSQALLCRCSDTFRPLQPPSSFISMSGLTQRSPKLSRLLPTAKSLNPITIRPLLLPVATKMYPQIDNHMLNHPCLGPSGRSQHRLFITRGNATAQKHCYNVSKLMMTKLAAVSPRMHSHTVPSTIMHPILVATHIQTVRRLRLHLTATHRHTATHRQTVTDRQQHMMHWWCAMATTARQGALMSRGQMSFLVKLCTVTTTGTMKASGARLWCLWVLQPLEKISAERLHRLQTRYVWHQTACLTGLVFSNIQFKQS